jgi:peptidoglycan hydrolase-like protein with peptidoglycan-binding domain
MAIYRLGSTGPEVQKLQERLKSLKFYTGPLDGKFGGGTEGAVIAFQRSAKLTVDGKVGDETWKALFGESQAPAPGIASQSLAFRCLAFTGSIETGAAPPECFAGLTGDFDGQGISFGAIQYALGAGSLGDFLRELDKRSPSTIDDVFHENAGVLRAVLKSPIDEQLTWARSIQHAIRNHLDEPWAGMFKALGRQPACQTLQVETAGRRFDAGVALCQEYGLWSERAVALMFDIKVQNGSISPLTKAQIQQDFANMTAVERTEIEVERLRIIARRRAAASKAEWAADVLARKMAIAEGAGVIHGRHYDLEADYGIRLIEFAAAVG